MRSPDLSCPAIHPAQTHLAALGILLAVAAIAPATGRGADRQPIAPRLERILADPGHAARQRDGRLAVWVYFVERGLTFPEREAALARAEAALPADVARRRSKVAVPGRRLVDAGDLPLDPEHLAAAAATGASPRHRSRWLDAASYDATTAQVRDLAALDCVRRLDLVWRSWPVYPVPEEDAPRPEASAPRSPADWTLDYGASLPGLELINVPPVHELGYTGAGVKLGMLDSGFHMIHEALDHAPILAAYDFVSGDTVVDTEPGDPTNAHAHGTMVTSTVVGYAPGDIVGPAYAASVILARAEDPSLSDPIEEDWWVAALEWAELQGADLVSSSLGFWTYYDYSDLDGDTAASTVAADLAAARGLLVVNGAGNQGGTGFDVIVAPADGDSVIAVGATDVNGVIAEASSSGPTHDGRTKPDVVAQGIQVPVADPYDDFGYTTTGGTSFSGPFVAGVAALILERAPFLTPVQVREALRATADHHDAPDNDYGWGLVDALAAVYYWGPHIAHEELPDTEDTSGPYVVAATVDDAFALEALSPRLHYRVDGGSWQDALMTALGGDEYAADIPGLPIGSLVEYYLEAADTQGLAARLPLLAPVELLSFTVWQDTQPPEVVHTPLGDQPLGSWPPAVAAVVTDNLGLAGVALSFAVNGGPASGPHAMLHGVGDLYALPFPLDAGELTAGDQVIYTITATDASAGANVTEDGPHSFTAVAGAGQILVIDDEAGGEATTVAAWLGDAGYATTVRAGAVLTAGDLTGRQAVVLLSGSNGEPLGPLTVRQNVRSWVDGGGRLLVEGGETGFAALVWPGYAVFAAEVLHASAWLGDDSGSLVAAPGQAGHDLLTRPSTVTPPLTLAYTAASEQDAVAPLADALVVLENADHPGTAGALVHDDNPVDPAAQVVYLPFALSALTDQDQARSLVLNALAHLLDTRMPSAVGDDPASPPRLARLLGAAPNPFNAHTHVRIETTAGRPVQLDVYDVRGRLVRRLLDGARSLPTGPHDIAWDGRDEHGRDAASGIYFVHLTAGGLVERGKLALVR